ncbi:MAG: hypothetical protein GPJ54_19020 [Candidatus Heimdallarchaeota archaeon]|nr:hypothetical protein [Candidatus Heimdallarchaeota archaeon]
MKKKSFSLIIFFLLLISASAVEEPDYTEVGFKIGEVYNFIVKENNYTFSKYTVPTDETFNMTVKSLPEEGFRVSQIDFQYKNITVSQPMSANKLSEYFIYNNWEYWTEIWYRNQTDLNTTYIKSVSSNDTTFTFKGSSESATEVSNWYYLFDLNGVIIIEKFTENGVMIKHIERVFPKASSTEMTPTSYIVTSNGETITEATIIDPLPFSLSYLYFLFLPILLKFKSRLA